MTTPTLPQQAEHPARAAAQRSMAAASTGDREAWLALFADDASVEDPVGPSWLDPDGNGHRGTAAIAAFYDRTIGTLEGMRFEIRDSFACGDEVANVGSIHLSLPGGAAARCDGVFVYRVDAEGRVVSLRAFWEVDRLAATARSAATSTD